MKNLNLKSFLVWQFLVEVVGRCNLWEINHDIQISSWCIHSSLYFSTLLHSILRSCHFFQNSSSVQLWHWALKLMLIQEEGIEDSSSMFNLALSKRTTPRLLGHFGYCANSFWPFRPSFSLTVRITPTLRSAFRDFFGVHLSLDYD